MACSATKPGDRGREARRPREFPRAGWRDILLRTKDGITRDHVSIVAAGVAFYTMLALFPALAAAISIWGLLADPQEIQQQIAALGGMLPPDVVDIVRQQGEKVAAGAGGVTLAAAGGLLLALWSASRGTNSLIEGLNICYGETEKRGLVKVNLVALGLTLAGTVGFVVALGLVAVLPALLGNLGLGATAAALVEWLRWPLLFVLMMAALAVVYRYAPSRRPAQWRWVTWGGVAATLLWMAGSVAFSVYVRNFASYNETYGSIGAVIVLLTWLWLSAFAVLLGAELNGEMEHQTVRDSTRGPERPLGRRGAYVADTVGDEP